jgi:hypothetical protein
MFFNGYNPNAHKPNQGGALTAVPNPAPTKLTVSYRAAKPSRVRHWRGEHLPTFEVDVAGKNFRLSISLPPGKRMQHRFYIETHLLRMVEDKLKTLKFAPFELSICGAELRPTKQLQAGNRKLTEKKK